MAEYPLPAYNYRVRIGKESIAFSEASGLAINYNTTVYKQSRTDAAAGIEAFLMPAQRGPTEITLKKGVAKGKKIRYLFDWINTIKAHTVDKRDVGIDLCDENGKEVITWKLIGAFPKKLAVPTFDAKSNEVAIESMDLVAYGVQITSAG